MADQDQDHSEDLAATSGPEDMHLGFSYLREDFKDLRQDLHQEVRDLRIEMQAQFRDTHKQMDSRFFWTLGFMTTLTAMQMAFVAALIKP